MNENLRVGEYIGPVVSPVSEGDGAPSGYQGKVWFAPLDGQELVYELTVQDATPEGARSVALQELDRARGAVVQSMTQDGPAAQRLIEAASHEYELGQALCVLDAADRSSDGDAARFLRVHAVNIYGRTWGSNARSDFSKFVDFSADDLQLHKKLKLLRNKYTAHSESSMTVTVPLVNLQRGVGGDVETLDVATITSESSWPPSFTASFRAMLERLREALQARLPILNAAVIDEIDREQRDELFQRPERVQMDPRAVVDWEPGEKRQRFPVSRMIPVYMVPSEAQDE